MHPDAHTMDQFLTTCQFQRLRSSLSVGLDQSGNTQLFAAVITNYANSSIALAYVSAIHSELVYLLIR